MHAIDSHEKFQTKQGRIYFFTTKIIMCISGHNDPTDVLFIRAIYLPCWIRKSQNVHRRVHGSFVLFINEGFIYYLYVTSIVTECVSARLRVHGERREKGVVGVNGQTAFVETVAVTVASRLNPVEGRELSCTSAVPHHLADDQRSWRE